MNLKTFDGIELHFTEFLIKILMHFIFSCRLRSAIAALKYSYNAVYSCHWHYTLIEMNMKLKTWEIVDKKKALVLATFVNFQETKRGASNHWGETK
jgi:hypothetical protein